MALVIYKTSYCKDEWLKKQLINLRHTIFKILSKQNLSILYLTNSNKNKYLYLKLLIISFFDLIIFFPFLCAYRFIDMNVKNLIQDWDIHEKKH